MAEPMEANVNEEQATDASPRPPRPLRKTTTSSSTKSQSSTSRRNSFSQTLRNASVRLIEANPPSGMWSATGQIASRAPSMSELRGATYSPTSFRRQNSQPLQSPPIQEHEPGTLHGDATSQVSVDDTPFMTPLQTPLAIVNSGWMDEPEEMDSPDREGERITAPPAMAGKAPSEHGSKSSDNTIQDEMGADANLMPAISLIDDDGVGAASITTSNRNSVISKRTSLPPSESGKRSSFISRIIKGKENEPPAPLPEEMSSTSKRHSKNLDKFFGEDVRNSREIGALVEQETTGKPAKRPSKDLDTPLKESTGNVVNSLAAPKRQTRDFADMVEGDDDDFPNLLFDRDSMPTQSYDPSQKRNSAKKDAPPLDPATNAKFQAAKARLAKDVQSEPPKIPLPAVDAAVENAGQRETAETGDQATKPSNLSDAEEGEGEEEEEEIDWDEFMREFDERPPRRTKGASKNMNDFLGADDEQPEPKDKEKRRPAPLAMVANGDSSPSKHSLRKAPIAADAPATQEPAKALAATEVQMEKDVASSPDDDIVYPTGYRFPPKKTAGQGFLAGLKAFWGFFITPLGFFVVLYGLLVVAWGGMLFLLLCNASPAMCTLGDGRYDCNDINSPRRVWVEYDSQILNALFCVTGFGLIPWRFRDFYYLLKFRLRHSEAALRKLAGFHNGWFRLPDSAAQPVPMPFTASRLDPAATDENPAYPLPTARAPLLPLTGQRAPSTPVWKLDFVIWAFVLNTALQAVLSGFMWGLNRYTRPSWSTGLFVALACIIAACGGFVQFVEGRKIKRVEGIPWDDGAEMDREMGLAAEEPRTEVTTSESQSRDTEKGPAS